MRTIPSRNVIVTCAVTGAIHTPTMSPHLPVTPEEIAEDAIAASEAGAAVIHLHVRDPESGEPVTDLDLFEEIAAKIDRETDVIVQPTTGGAPTMAPEERVQVVPRLDPEMCSCNMGSINFGLYPMAENYDEWEYDWETEYLEGTDTLIFQNSFADLEVMLETMDDHDVVPSLECYDVGHLYNLGHCIDQGWIDPPLHLEFVLGINGGIDADPKNLAHLKTVADGLFGDEYSFSTIGAGRSQFELTTQSISMGGHARVGLEDNLYLRRGKLAESNADQVEKIVDLAWEVSGREPASADEVREFLALKGSDATAFN
ncbi:3-keto-5-aminohexanoate cleavage protein [Natrinema gelatinilyticum]|uniref:3-keto-5-aminohexanoate cleavage protein n=1 Tax=Natrinema gelatinilyticum TaxID=2961571 RepID=UPI0020C2A783|nr:3-keto-5-aminohexanoate cleavage protein [Natrinema gelatinilyticum]